MEAPRHSAALALFLALSVCPAFSARAQEISNPELFEKSIAAAREAIEHYGVYHDPTALRRVADVGYRLAVVSDFRDFPFTFYLVDMPVPNAFALPGGQIFVTRGMLGLGLSDDMLAALLGHEIAHVTKRHGTRLQKRATLLNTLSQVLLLGVLIGVDDQPENPNDPYGYTGSRKGSLVQGAAATGVVVSELLLRNYSREFEDEADDEGQRLAAGAGFDPDGARQLWELMNQRLPQSNTYGYWRTHPFSDSRMRSANARAAELTILPGKPAEDYRANTQKVLLEFTPKEKKAGEKKEGEQKEGEKKETITRFLENSALTAWPRGGRAEQIRLARLHDARENERKEPEIGRDYGQLVRAYREQIEEVRALTPDTPFLAQLETEMSELRTEADGLYPKAQAVLAGEIFETPFLVSFLSNYPTAPEAPRVALALGDAYSRLGRQSDAVEQYLRAAETGPGTPEGERALAGLRNLASFLTQLAALEQLGSTAGDETLRRLADERLDQLASSYDAIENGAEYLRRFPDGDHAVKVSERLETLAKNLYGEVLLYQAVGDNVKALEKIQLILTHAPLTTAADRLRENAELEG